MVTEVVTSTLFSPVIALKMVSIVREKMKAGAWESLPSSRRGSRATISTVSTGMTDLELEKMFGPYNLVQRLVDEYKQDLILPIS